MRAGWRSRLTVTISILLITVIGALSPLYTALVTQVGMVQRLDAQTPSAVHIFTRFGINASTADLEHAWTTLDTNVRETVLQLLSTVNPAWIESTAIWGESAPMFVIREGVDIPALKLRAAYIEDWESHTQSLEGAVTPSGRADFAGAITHDIANRFGLAVGEVITLDQRGWDTSRVFTLEITSIVAPLEPDDPYWMAPSPLRLDRTQNGVEANVFVSRESLLQIIGDYTPQASGAMGWRFLFNHHALPFGRLNQASDQIANAQAQLEQIVETDNGFTLTFTTDLTNVLNAYASEINLLNAPFGVLMLQVAALVLFFLLITATLAQRSERPELAMLQNRGALEGQILLLRALEAMFVCTAAALVAPFIARQLLIFGAPLLTGAAQITLELDAQPFVYAGAMALWALAVLLITLRPVLRLPLISAGGSTVRAARQSWWQRYYLDLLLVIVGSVALFRLLSTNTPFTQSLLGGLQADPLLLIAPALLFMALGSITLRIFPPLTDITARSLAGRRGLESVLATWSISRDPAHYARLTFLLALAIGIGWFAISFQTTLDQSHTDQARYQVGADVRLVEQNTQTDTTRPEGVERYLQQEGVRSAAVAYRLENLNLSLDGLGIEPGHVLAVDPGPFTETAYWRDDLGMLTLPPPAQELPQGIPLPSETRRIGVRLRLYEILLDLQSGERRLGLPQINTLFSEFTVFVRLRSADGTYTQVQLIPRSVDGVEDLSQLWTLNFNVSPFEPAENLEAERMRLEAALEGVSGWISFDAELDSALTADTVLDTVYWRTNLRSAWTPLAPRQLELSSLDAFDGDDQPLSSDLLSRPDWSLTMDNAAALMTTELTPPLGDDNAWTIFWTQRQERSIFGLGLNPPAPPIPAVVSAPFAAQNALDRGAVFELYIDSRPYTFVVDGITDYFPTLYADRAPFVVADLNAMMLSLNQRAGAAAYPNEVLIALEDGINAGEWVGNRALTAENTTIISGLTVGDVREQISDDVLMLGLSRLLLIAFIISLALSLFSLLAYAALNAQNRREQFAVLRALGMSSQRIAISAAVEQGIVFLVAALLGTVMGALLSAQVLPTLAISSDGRALTPPFVVQIDSAAVFQFTAILVGLLVLVLIVTAVMIRRMSLSQALRYREE